MFLLACCPAEVAPAEEALIASEASLAVSARVPAIPVGSGRAAGGVIETIGCPSGEAFRSSVVARVPVWTAAISVGWIGIGESCQFQNRVMSSFSDALNLPRT